MSGVIPLSKIQYGRETVVGTEAEATNILRVEGAFLEDIHEFARVPENVGLLVDTDRTIDPAVAAALTIPENNASFEQLIHILEMGMKTISGVKDGAGSGYIYTYDMPTTAQLTPKTYTFEGGDDQQAMVMVGAFADEFTISGKVREPWKFSAGLIGQKAENTTFTAGISIPDISEMLFQNSKLYINDAASGFGATLIANTLLGFSLKVKTGYVARFTAGGTLYYSYLKQTKPEFTLDLTVEHNATAQAEITKGRAMTARLVRILCEGPALALAGTSYSKKSCIIDLAGKYVGIPKIEDEDNSSVMTFTLKGGYNSTISTMGKLVVVNEITDWDEELS